ncbi:MAG: prepilin-type N-terminal cleavage/methylation domain-containing protein [Planctomycetota bacterium]
MPQRRRTAFTLIELLVVISIIALLIAILLPALGAARRSARQMANSTQLRGIHQGMVTFAQDNKGYFPGLRNDGTIATAAENNVDGTDATRFTVGTAIGADPVHRVAVMLNLDLFTPEYVINPGDNNTSKAPGVIDTNLTADNYSYAMLRTLADDGTVNTNGRIERAAQEWAETINAQAPVMADRNVGNNATDEISSVWTDLDSGEWRGGIVFNDNVVIFEAGVIQETTKYATFAANNDDNLFVDTGTQLVADAALIYNGTGQGGGNLDNQD